MKVQHEFIDWYKLKVENEINTENDEERVSLTYKNTLGETILFIDLENKDKTVAIETFGNEVKVVNRNGEALIDKCICLDCEDQKKTEAIQKVLDIIIPFIGETFMTVGTNALAKGSLDSFKSKMRELVCIYDVKLPVWLEYREEEK